MTIILRPPTHFDALESLPVIGALAVSLALQSEFEIMAKVRWPNDVTFSGRKLGGTLAEGKFSGNDLEHVLLGLGLNANFSRELIAAQAVPATTTQDILGHDVDKAELISSILLELERLYEEASAGESRQILALLRQNELSLGKRVEMQFERGILTGVLEDYEKLSTVRVRDDLGNVQSVETSHLVYVAYHDD